MARKMFGWAAAAAAGLVVAAGGALAHDLKGPMPKTPGGKAAYVRHENFKKQGAAFKAINDELRKGDPDKALIAKNAATLKALTAQLPTWFPKGSGPESGFKTDAKPEVWADAAGFQAAVNRLQVEASKLNQVAAGGDINAVKGQVRATGGACKNCHDKFRVPEKT
jgi:cytochrome c556